MKLGLFTEKSAEAEGAPAPPPVAVPAVAAGSEGAAVAGARDRRCCCGCSLATGAVVIGTLDVVHGFTILYLSLLSINNVHVAGGIVMVLFGFFQITTGMGLIFGADQARSKFILLWLYTHYVELGLFIGYWLIAVGSMIYNSAPAEPVLAAIASFTLGTGILAYCIAIVRSLYRQVIGLDNLLPLRETI